MVDPQDAASERLDAVRAMMFRAQRRHGPVVEDVRLVAVSKTVSQERLMPFLAAGQRLFAENRVQEAKAKWPALRECYEGIELHLIGPLQTNKVREAVAVFDVIETLDRDRLASVLAVEMARAGRRLPCYVQVNIGLEPQKAGIAPGEAVDFVRRCRAEHSLDVPGLMCIPPEHLPSGPYFAQMARLGQEAGCPLLSMGMSADFETAIAMGATQVRIGSTLFGTRSPLS